MPLTPLRASLINFLLPNRCSGCGAILTPCECLCPACEEAVLLPHDDYCHVCGKVFCTCKRLTRHYDHVVLCSRYTGNQTDPAVRAMWELKNSHNTNFARFAAKIIAERLKNSVEYGSFDLITAVPMHHGKQRLRGYNQAELIARFLSAELDLPYRNDLLHKTRTKTAQHNLSAAERAKNVMSFHSNHEDLSGLRILLCDDVLTTGATLDRCADLLKKDGASYICAAAAATTNRLTEREETGSDIADAKEWQEYEL